jgi:hypothetical protein
MPALKSACRLASTPISQASVLIKSLKLGIIFYEKDFMEQFINFISYDSEQLFGK